MMAGLAKPLSLGKAFPGNQIIMEKTNYLENTL
jgi:hypothetical protein